MGFGLGGIVGGAIGSVFGPAGSAIGYGLGSSLESNYQANRAWNNSKDFTWEMWHANNDYNSPKSQMQRLEEAGLNPNLVYGNGAVSHQATMATTPRYQQPQMAGAQEAMMFSQLANMESQRDLTDAQERKVDVESGIKKEQLKREKKRNEIIERTGFDPEGSGPLSWVSRPAVWIADRYQDFENGVRKGLHYFFD